MTQALYLGHSLGTRAGAEGLLCVASFNLDSDNHPILQLGKLRLREGEGPAQGHTARRPLGSEGLSLAPGPFVVLLPSPAARCTGLPGPYPAGPQGPSHTGSSESTPLGAPGSQPRRSSASAPRGALGSQLACACVHCLQAGTLEQQVRPHPDRPSLPVQLQTRPHMGALPRGPRFPTDSQGSPTGKDQSLVDWSWSHGHAAPSP